MRPNNLIFLFFNIAQDSSEEESTAHSTDFSIMLPYLHAFLYDRLDQRINTRCGIKDLLPTYLSQIKCGKQH